jgi:hypothetical protein
MIHITNTNTNQMKDVQTHITTGKSIRQILKKKKKKKEGMFTE